MCLCQAASGAPAGADLCAGAVHTGLSSGLGPPVHAVCRRQVCGQARPVLGGPSCGPCPGSRRAEASCAQIRTSVLQLLTALQIDLTDEQRKAQLTTSGLGKVVMFLSRLPDETPTNRRLAKARAAALSLRRARLQGAGLLPAPPPAPVTAAAALHLTRTVRGARRGCCPRVTGVRHSAQDAACAGHGAGLVHADQRATPGPAHPRAGPGAHRSRGAQPRSAAAGRPRCPSRGQPASQPPAAAPQRGPLGGLRLGGRVAKAAGPPVQAWGLGSPASGGRQCSLPPSQLGCLLRPHSPPSPRPHV